MRQLADDCWVDQALVDLSLVLEGALQRDDLAVVRVLGSVHARHVAGMNWFTELVAAQAFIGALGIHGHGACSAGSDWTLLNRKSAAPPSSGAGPSEASPSGMTMVKVVPASSTLATEIRPSWRFTMPSTIASPRPVPRSLVV